MFNLFPLCLVAVTRLLLAVGLNSCPWFLITLFWDGSVYNFNGYWICNVMGLGFCLRGFLCLRAETLMYCDFLMGTLCDQW